MHREVSDVDDLFGRAETLGLYLLTAGLALLIGRDLAPSVLPWLGLESMFAGRELFGYRYALLAAIIGGARILFHSLEAMFEGRFVAEIAIAVAAIGAILLREPLVAAEVIFIAQLGECLEAWTLARAQHGIRKLVEVFPQRCWLLRDGQEVRVLINEVRRGDKVVVKPGGKIPVDGVVLEGESSVDASALTGESIPLDRVPGDAVLAGSLNQFGQLTIEAKKVAEETVAGRAIQLTAQALRNKAPIERTVDRYASWFLPAVLAAAMLIFLLNVVYQTSLRPAEVRLSFNVAARLSLYPALAVLVVACPCALVLATPAAVIAALGRLAGTGILIKGSIALERLAQVQAFAFDKTGTLTEGKLELGDIIAFNNLTDNDILRTAALAEQGSEHPLGKMIVDEARSRVAHESRRQISSFSRRRSRRG